jgi:hypothetical protein
LENNYTATTIVTASIATITAMAILKRLGILDMEAVRDVVGELLAN